MPPRWSRIPVAAFALTVVACASGRPSGDESAPHGRLPDDVRPLRYELELEILPDRERFTGRARIDLALTRSRRTLWMHGRDLRVDSVEIEGADGSALRARWEPAEPAGIAAVRLPRALGPGRATLRIHWSAEFGRRLRGLYRVDHGGDAYAFTQFEPTSAREAFPCFDEPAFKTPFDVTLLVRREHVAVANTPEVERSQAGDGRARVRFATTPPLPTYLVAWAVGPLDARAGPPLPSYAGDDVAFRGFAPRGRGGELAFALAHTPPLLRSLEGYFGGPYPFAKLDVIAVPDFSAGAMENPGAITFRDSLLLLDGDSAPERQIRDFTYVMAHELAHQWFGNLVTMPWWDDLWLNEAFATWLGFRTVDEIAPGQNARLALLQHAHEAMRADSLASARRIRQPIASQHDIPNAFDGITYSKGGAVLAMFERWLGPDTFRAGIRRYVAAHRGATARSADLLAALSQAAGRDVATPFATFLEQPGVPLVAVRTRCGPGTPELALRQSRYLPLGSSAPRGALWQIPICARYQAGGRTREICGLLREREGTLALDGDRCPDWVMPNADGAGYYRFALAGEDRPRLFDSGLPRLSEAGRLAVADSLEAGFRSGALRAGEVFAWLGRLAADESRSVAEAPIPLLQFARDELAGDALRPAAEALAARLYSPRLRHLGWSADPGDNGERRLLRAAVVGALAELARDPGVRGEALRRGRRYAGLARGSARAGVEPELVETVLRVAVQDGGEAVFDALLERLEASDDALERSRLLAGLGAAIDPVLAVRARELALDPRLRVNEVTLPLRAQLDDPRTRDATWEWIERRFEALVERVGTQSAGWMPWLAASFCEADRAREVAAFFEPRIGRLEGGPRNLAGALEAIRLCAALAEDQRADARAFLSGELSRAPAGAR